MWPLDCANQPAYTMYTPVYWYLHYNHLELKHEVTYQSVLNRKYLSARIRIGRTVSLGLQQEALNLQDCNGKYLTFRIAIGSICTLSLGLQQEVLYLQDCCWKYLFLQDCNSYRKYLTFGTNSRTATRSIFLQDSNTSLHLAFHLGLQQEQKFHSYKDCQG